jgi:hypothetical protein
VANNNGVGLLAWSGTAYGIVWFTAPATNNGELRYSLACGE